MVLADPVRPEHEQRTVVMFLISLTDLPITRAINIDEARDSSIHQEYPAKSQTRRGEKDSETAIETGGLRGCVVLSGSAVWLWTGKNLVWTPISMPWSWDKPNIVISPMPKGGLALCPNCTTRPKGRPYSENPTSTLPVLYEKTCMWPSRPKKTIPFPCPEPVQFRLFWLVLCSVNTYCLRLGK